MIVELVATGSRDGEPFQATHLVLMSLRTNTPQKHFCNCSDTAGATAARTSWAHQGWHWICETQLQEAAHPCLRNRTDTMATLRTAALTL